MAPPVRTLSVWQQAVAPGALARRVPRAVASVQRSGARENAIAPSTAKPCPAVPLTTAGAAAANSPLACWCSGNGRHPTALHSLRTNAWEPAQTQPCMVSKARAQARVLEHTQMQARAQTVSQGDAEGPTLDLDAAGGMKGRSPSDDDCDRPEAQQLMPEASRGDEAEDDSDSDSESDIGSSSDDDDEEEVEGHSWQPAAQRWWQPLAEAAALLAAWELSVPDAAKQEGTQQQQRQQKLRLQLQTNRRLARERRRAAERLALCQCKEEMRGPQELAPQP